MVVLFAALAPTIVQPPSPTKLTTIAVSGTCPPKCSGRDHWWDDSGDYHINPQRYLYGERSIAVEPREQAVLSP
jgi:hypothetical protein